MEKSAFNIQHQIIDVESKIIAGLERISEAFKVLLWEKAKTLGLSPIQIQIIIFIAYHKRSLCNVSHLAKEFNVTKPTISDAIKVLDKKSLILKDYSQVDNRSYLILLSEKGESILRETAHFALPIKKQFLTLGKEELDELYKTLSKLIYQLNRAGILTVQRTCYACKFYDHTGATDYCNLLNKELLNTDIRIDCAEFEEKE